MQVLITLQYEFIFAAHISQNSALIVWDRQRATQQRMETVNFVGWGLTFDFAREIILDFSSSTSVSGAALFWPQSPGGKKNGFGKHGEIIDFSCSVTQILKILLVNWLWQKSLFRRLRGVPTMAALSMWKWTAKFPGAWQCNLKQVAWRGLTDLGSEHFESTHTDKYVQCSSRKTPDYVLLHNVF